MSGEKMGLEKVSVLIPAYKPDEKLIHTVEELVGAGFSDILIVDDGSGEAYGSIFDAVKELSVCTVLVHEVNRGKGAALKTAFKYVTEHKINRACVVTADADGQHMPSDIKAVAEAALLSGNIVLGVRDFAAPDVPARSKFGNNMTKGVFRLFFGMKIQDTQTGLRAIPVEYLEGLLTVRGERYEYETNMLFWTNKEKLILEQVGIHTVYLDENSSSHFRPIRDSIRVYGLILKYLFSSCGAAVIDASVFYLLKRLAFSTFPAAFLARAVSSVVNFCVNAKVVFGERTNAISVLKYYVLAVAQIAVSTLLVFGVEHTLGIVSPLLSTCAKIVIDTLLFFVSFRIQHKWVFATTKGGKKVTCEKEENNL